MVAPLIWGGLAVAGLFGLGYTAKEGTEAMDATARALKWAAVGGGLYVSYRALQAGGALK